MMRVAGTYKDAKTERNAKSHRKRRLKLWAQRFANPEASICRHCGGPIERHYGRGQPKRYCSPSCRQAEHANHGDQIWEGHHATGTIGAIGELMVSADLLRRGYHVFRSLSPNAVCDLAIITGGVAIRVEVTKAYKTKTGRLEFSPHDKTRFDVLALWCTDGTVHYIPELPETAGAGPLKYSDKDGRAVGGEGVGAADIRSA